ncbi:MAG: hypothetical protein U9R32_11355 [Bacteroidota bacterium]|nr:hypothetical protein [Bacteroidota bacterium]
MRKIIFTIGICFLSYIAFAQYSEPSDTIYLHLSDARAEIKDISGWQNRGDGNWLNAKNKIPFILTQEGADQALHGALSRKEEKKIQKKLKASREDKKLGQDNLQAMTISDMNINNQAYQVLMLKRVVGEYEFPMIKEGFSSHETLDYYVFKAKKVEEIFPNQLVFNKPYVVNLEAYVSGEIPYFKSKDVKALITRKIQMGLYKHSLRSFSTDNLLIALYPLMKDGEKLMRFNLIRSFNKYYVTRGYYEEKNLNKIFDNRYYETLFDLFHEFVGSVNSSIGYSDVEPTTFEGFYKLGVRQYNYGDYYNSIANFDRALRLNPNCDDFIIYSQRGNAKHQLSDFFGAIEDYNHALDLEPDAETYELWMRNYYNRGVSKFRLGDARDACVDWKKAFENGVEDAKILIEDYCQ